MDERRWTQGKVYFLVGPTASGKTELSIRLAKKFEAEIISCDSMCVYRYMDVLTSKPSLKDRKKVKHHLIDIIPPTEEWTVADYRRLALQSVEDILSRGKIPLFVGGSGLYIKSVIDGIFPSTKKDINFRRKMGTLAHKYGNMYLYKKLKKIDPISAMKVHPNNLRRVIRTLEIYHTEKKKPSLLRKFNEPIEYKVRIFGLAIDRERRYKNIEQRVEAMFKKGIVEEVKALSKMRLSLTAKQAIGYKEVLGYLEGRYSLEEAKDLLKKRTRHFAKRQETWFRKDNRIEWKRRF
jgi:tRNA dimethylallyltransferase